MRPFSNCLFDVESNGLLPGMAEPAFCMDRIHVLHIMCLDTMETKKFKRNDKVDNIEEGVQIIMDADFLTGHNILGFDLEAIRLVYPYFKTEARIYDTLVMSRMCFANIKESDFRLLAAGKIPGKLLGRHGLEAWGYRLGLNKGDYSKDKKEELIQIHKDKGLDAPTPEEIHYHVWGTWNQEMDDYCFNDVELNELLYRKIIDSKWSETSTVLEHNIHALMVQQEINGFSFNIEMAESLESQLRETYNTLSAEATKEIGIWYRPAKFHDSEDEGYKEEYGENKSRRKWGEITFPKKTMSRSKSNRKVLEDGLDKPLLPDMTEGAAFVKVELKEFNPNSRPQIIDRLTVLYGWEPADFTEKGSARVDDEVLRTLSDQIPIAETLAELFFTKKLLGMIADGQNGWLKLVQADGRIHGRVNVGGAVTGRATHAAPNMSQVPAVQPVEFKEHEAGLKFIEANKESFTPYGLPTIVTAKYNERKGEWKILTRGRTGKFGYDSRELFTVRAGFKLVGCDLSGVEFRCLGNLTFPFDDGEIIDLILNGDIHQHNADVCSISRGQAKTALYACLYGAGDSKLGSIIEPFSSESRQRLVGKTLRDKLMKAMPSLKKAISEIHKEMRRNSSTIAGLDGRRLFVRSKHAALNTRLQSDGALIAKKWLLNIDDSFYDEGWDHGNDHHYAFVNWSHDETEVSIRESLANRAKDIMEEQALRTGEYFNFHCPIIAEGKIGMTWAEVH